VGLLDSGAQRVAERSAGGWLVNEWLKKAVLLYFRTHDNQAIEAGYTRFYDKVPLKYAQTGAADFAAGGRTRGAARPGQARRLRGAERGADAQLREYRGYVDSGTMVDTWATVGSCAQIGRDVHLSGGVGIGGVLEPLQAGPTIIEDNCFIGAVRRSSRA